MKDQVFQIIDSLNADYIQKWVDSCNIESPTPYKEGVDAVGAYWIALAALEL